MSSSSLLISFNRLTRHISIFVSTFLGPHSCGIPYRHVSHCFFFSTLLRCPHHFLLRYHLVLFMVADVSEKVATSVPGCINEAGDSSFLQNGGNHLPDHSVPHLGRQLQCN